jgi:hypothetical protein
MARGNESFGRKICGKSLLKIPHIDVRKRQLGMTAPAHTCHHANKIIEFNKSFILIIFFEVISIIGLP